LFTGSTTNRTHAIHAPLELRAHASSSRPRPRLTRGVPGQQQATLGDLQRLGVRQPRPDGEQRCQVHNHRQRRVDNPAIAPAARVLASAGRYKNGGITYNEKALMAKQIRVTEALLVEQQETNRLLGELLRKA